jgi:molybdopterin synthase catalytic subunit
MSVRIQTEPFDLSAEVAALTADRTDIGAIVTFTGAVRGEVKTVTDAASGAAGAKLKTRSLASMTLEHYPGMTEAELARVEAEAHARWPLQASLIIHRVGELVPGEGIVLVVAASPHRHAAFEAASFLMDYLKTRAPFWKKETGVDGTGDWVDARESDHAALERWN